MVFFTNAAATPKVAPRHIVLVAQSYPKLAGEIQKDSTVRSKSHFGGATGKSNGKLWSNDIPRGSLGRVIEIKRRTNRDHTVTLSYLVQFEVNSPQGVLPSYKFTVRQTASKDDLEFVA